MAELAACYTGRQTVITDGNLLVDPLIRKIVGALGHGSNKNADTLVWAERVDVFANAHHRSVKAKGYLATIGG